MLLNQKIGAIYSIFDGEELLKTSIQSIKCIVDFVVVVFQKSISTWFYRWLGSNYDEECHPFLEGYLNQLKDEGLIDKLIEYTGYVYYYLYHLRAHLKKKKEMIFYHHFQIQLLMVVVVVILIRRSFMK